MACLLMSDSAVRIPRRYLDPSDYPQEAGKSSEEGALGRNRFREAVESCNSRRDENR